MAVLNSKKILQEKNTSDPDSITSLNLTHKALSDVSCLSEFKNLERLDLGFNNLTSLEGLKSCVNLKWLSVVQNKLQSLKGIEGLTKLTVLNAGKNKLKSMDEVKSLVNLRALILNENDISAVCKLDQMKELNTLVLSRNLISSLGESLAKVRSITKLSLSNCQLQSIESSLNSCTELKELRLAHNEIKTVPTEFGHLVKLQNLDMGNNLITSQSSLKVLASLVNLRNLNLRGNPVAEKENTLWKVKRLLPNLHIFNARPVDKISEKEMYGKDSGFSDEAFNTMRHQSEGEADHSVKNDNSEKAHPLIGRMDRKKRKNLMDETSTPSAGTGNNLGKRMEKKSNLQQNESRTANMGAQKANDKEEKKLKHKKQKKELGSDKEPDKKLWKKMRGDEVIDSAEIPFADLFAAGAPEASVDTAAYDKADQNVDAISGLITLSKKKKKNRAVNPTALELSQVVEIGLGGPSAWDDM